MNPHIDIDLAVPVNAMDHVLGPDHAGIVVVEYGDFECPLCKQAAPAVKMLLQRFDERVRFVFRHFPLESLHPHALQAAQAAECAGSQGMFWQMHDLLFANQEHLKLKNLRSYALQLGLDMAPFDAEMADSIYLQRIREHIDGGRRSHLKSTPGFFVNGVIVDVSFGLHALVDATAAALESQHDRSASSRPDAARAGPSTLGASRRE